MYVSAAPCAGVVQHYMACVGGKSDIAHLSGIGHLERDKAFLFLESALLGQVVHGRDTCRVIA